MFELTHRNLNGRSCGSPRAGFAQEGDKISMPASILSELMRKQAEIPWQFELKLVRRKGPGKFEPVDVPAPPRAVRFCCRSISLDGDRSIDRWITRSRSN